MTALRLTHQECWELLPWHANGTLGPDEAARVEEHLAACAICREEVRACRELALGLAGEAEPGGELTETAGARIEADAAIGAGLGGEPEGEYGFGSELESAHDSAIGGGAEAGLVRVLARIDAAEAVALEESTDAPEAAAARRRSGRRALGAGPGPAVDAAHAGWRALASATPRPVRRLLAAQAAALVVLLAGGVMLGGALLGGDRPGGAPAAAPGEFRTLSDPAPAIAPAGAGRVRVVFAEDAAASAVRDLLLAAGARVVDGPSPFGVYTVAPAAAGETGVGDLLARLREDPVVVFAEPALAAPPRPEETP